MKSQFTSFDIAAMVREFQSCIGLRAEKFFLIGHNELFFRLSGPGDKKSISIKLGQAMWLEDGFRTTVDSEPPTFAMLLRKYLSGSALKKVTQHGFDRIVIFEFETQEQFRLIAELFGTGNLILVRGDTIVQPLTSKSWKAREVKAGKIYEFPPESADPFSLDLPALTSVIRNSNRDLVRCLATEVNLGGAYAEEACHELGREKNDPAKDITDDEIEELRGIILSFWDKMDEPSPHILIDRDGLQTDVLPFELSMHSLMEKKPIQRFSEAVKEYFANLPANIVTPGKSAREAQLERQLASQEEALLNLDVQTKEYQELGDMLYSEYAGLDKLLSSVQKLLGSGNWQAASSDILGFKGVKSFDPSEGILTVSMADGREARLDVRANLNENAAMMYDKSKKARHKAEGAKAALIETKNLLEGLRKAGIRERDQVQKKPTKKFWFDRFRWFISSEGFLVVGGRDTRTNDLLVKKHLKDGDLYVHADANGAPSIVIKEGTGAGEATLEEACIYAVSFSKAWKSQLASGNAYWVKPDQVSKTPNPGEFVPKGAFIIRGKRNYSRKLEIRLAIAMVDVQGSPKVMCGPVNAVAAKTKDYYLFVPGDEKRSNFAKLLSDAYSVPIEEIDRALPPGDVSVTKLIPQ
ncbi:MAG: ribosome rescue protein RqcH [Thermoplasmata archaeon]|nr:ribosome rescue protein RqcH [Thermoplasmata archaeon]